MNEIVKQEEQESEIQYFVVKNHEEQYSIWPTYKPMPLGWEAVGEGRSKEACLKYIDEVWTDMRPLSLRKQMEELARQEKDQKEKESKKAQHKAGKSNKKSSKKAGKK